MKQFNFLKNITFIASVAVMLMMSACEKKEPDVKPDEDKPTATTPLAWKVEVDTVTYNSIEATVTPSNLAVPYYVAIHSATEVGTDSAATLAKNMIAAEGFAKKLVMGKKKVAASDLTPATAYYVVAFEYDTLNKAVANKIFLSEKITTAAEAYAETITLTYVEGSATWRNAVINVATSSEGLPYIRGIMTKADWDATYAANPEQKVADDIAKWKTDLEKDWFQGNETWQDYMTMYRTDEAGDVAMSDVMNLHWDTEFVFYCYGMNDEGLQTTNVVFKEFATLKPEASDNKFTITIDETTKTSVNFTVTATNNDPYFVTIQANDYLARFEEAQDYDGLIWDLVALKLDHEFAPNIFSGSRSFTNEDISKEVNGFKEYKVIVWGFDEGPTTTVTFSETFKPGTTHQAVAPYEIAVENITWCAADVTMTPLSETDTYILAGMPKADFETMDAEAIYAKHKSLWERMANSYGTTWQEEMRYYTKTGAFEGTANDVIGNARLHWNTDYVVYCFGVNAEGEMITKVASAEFKTLAPTPVATTFAISIDAMTRSSVKFTIEPSDANTPYYVTIETTDYVGAYGPDKEQSYEDMIYDLLPDADVQLETRLFKGKQTLTEESVGRTVNGFKNYYIVVWGFDEGPTTSVTLSESFKPADPE